VADYSPKVRIIRQPHGGASRARNRGVLATAAPYIAFMDQDDLWAPKKLERQVELLADRADLGLCYSGVTVFSGTADLRDLVDSSVLDYEVVLPNPKTTPGVSPLTASLQHFAKSFVVPSSTLIRRSALADAGLLDPFLPFSGDFDALIKIGGRHGVARLHHADVLYRKHEGNYSDRYEVGRREVEALIARYVAYANATGDKSLAQAAPGALRRPRGLYAAQAYDRARVAARRRDYREAARQLTRAACFSPRVVARSFASYVAARR
jgi:glycosyltransferase involved in cell wall biosynthesis